MIELLVVISLIALLMAILLPGLRQARETARGVQCLSQQRQLMQCIYAYVTDWRDYIPPHMLEGPTLSSHVAWMTRLNRAHYLEPLTLTAQKTLAARSNDLRLCPAVSEDPRLPFNSPDAAFSHYTMAMEVTGYWNAEQWLFERTPVTLGAVTKPSQTMATTDGFYETSTNLMYSNTMQLGEDMAPAYRARPGMIYVTTVFDSRWRHAGNSTIFSFLDGHAERRRWDEADPYSQPYLPYYKGGFGKLLGPLRGKNYDG